MTPAASVSCEMVWWLWVIPSHEKTQSSPRLLATGAHTQNDVFAAIAHLLGALMDSFGQDRYCKGPLPGLT